MATLSRSIILAIVFCCNIFVLSLPNRSFRNPLLTAPTKPTEHYNLTDPMPFLGVDYKLTEAQLKSGIIGENYRWRNGFFVYIDRSFNDNERAIINNALYDIHIQLCIDVLIWPVDASPSGDYVHIIKSQAGCWSYVGRLGGRQELNLEAPGCVHQGVATHEAIHALGFFHEQSRPDRDDHVRVLYENIIAEYHYAFDKMGWNEVGTFDVPYDLVSIMHYNQKDFSSNGGDTVQSLNGSPVGSRQVMTGSDITKLRRMYNC